MGFYLYVLPFIGFTLYESLKHKNKSHSDFTSVELMVLDNILYVYIYGWESEYGQTPLINACV